MKDNTKAAIDTNHDDNTINENITNICDDKVNNHGINNDILKNLPRIITCVVALILTSIGLIYVGASMVSKGLIKLDNQLNALFCLGISCWLWYLNIHIKKNTTKSFLNTTWCNFKKYFLKIVRAIRQLMIFTMVFLTLVSLIAILVVKTGWQTDTLYSLSKWIIFQLNDSLGWLLACVS